MSKPRYVLCLHDFRPLSGGAYTVVKLMQRSSGGAGRQGRLSGTMPTKEAERLVALLQTAGLKVERCGPWIEEKAAP